MTEMRERIARAISPLWWNEEDRKGLGSTTISSGKFMASQTAKAVLKAMLEPTDEMLMGAYAATRSPTPNSRDIWQAMITAALGDTTDG